VACFTYYYNISHEHKQHQHYSTTTVSSRFTAARYSPGHLDRRAAAAAGPARERTELAQALTGDLLLGVDQVELAAGVPQGLRVHAEGDSLAT
jgi:hypothetical protein